MLFPSKSQPEALVSLPERISNNEDVPLRYIMAFQATHSVCLSVFLQNNEALSRADAQAYFHAQQTARETTGLSATHRY